MAKKTNSKDADNAANETNGANQATAETTTKETTKPKYQLTPPVAVFAIDSEGVALCTQEGFATVYKYHHDTGEYVGAEYLWRSLDIGLPADCALDAPNPPDNNCAIVRDVKNAGAWIYPTDLRGQTAYNIDNQQQETINYIGGLKEGFTLEKPTSPFDEWNGSAWIFSQTKQDAFTLNQNQTEKNRLLKIAEEQIEHLADLLAEDEVTEEDKALSKAWRSYRAGLRKFTAAQLTAPDFVFPTAPALAFVDEG